MWHKLKLGGSREVPDGKATHQDLENLRNEVAFGTITPDFYQLEVGEVMNVYLDELNLPDSPNSEDSVPNYDKFGGVKVRMAMPSKRSSNISFAYPLESNIKEYPLPGELVVVVEYANKLFYTQKLNIL